MKRLSYALIAMLFCGMVMSACSSDKSDDDDDDDDTGKSKKTEKVSEGLKPEKALTVPTSAGVQEFCDFFDSVSEFVLNAQTAAEIENAQPQLQAGFEKFKNDQTPLTDADREKIALSVGNTLGVVMGRAIALSGTEVSEEQLEQAIDEMGKYLEQAVMNANTIAEFCQNMSNI